MSALRSDLTTRWHSLPRTSPHRGLVSDLLERETNRELAALIAEDRFWKDVVAAFEADIARSPL